MTDVPAHTYFQGTKRLDDGSVESWAACHCGWESEHSTHYTYDLHQIAYRDHIVEALGEMAYYEAPVVCLNCSYRGDAKVIVGKDVWSAICPMCGASGRLRPDNDAIHEEHDREKRWRF